MQISKSLLNFLLTVEIVPKPEDQIHFEFQELSYGTNEYQMTFFLKMEKLFQKEAIYGEIGKILNSFGHPVNDEIINGVTALFGLSEKAIRNINFVNNFFSLIEKCKVKHYMFFNGEQEEKIYKLQFKDFTIGDIDYERFSKFINDRSGSDYASKYKSELSDKAGIEIKNYEIRIFDIYKWGIFINRSIDLRIFQKELINFYLTAVSMHSIKGFKERFYKQQEFINSYFGLYYPLEKFETFGYTFVSIFYNFLSDYTHGWVVPIFNYYNKMFFPDPRIVEEVNKFLLVNGNEIYEKESEFSRYFESVCSIFSNAEKHILAKNYSHAFVDFFVGLDFLLAPDFEKSKKLKERTSMLTYKGMARSFEDQLSRVRELYEQRNNYVHEGIQVKIIDLIELRNIGRIVLSTLLLVHTKSKKNSKFKFSIWILKIDELVQGISKGKSPNIRQLAEIGVNKQAQLFLQDTLDKWSFESN
jgi:hypothetical protein